MKKLNSINDMLASKNANRKIDFEIKDDSLMGELRKKGIEIIPNVDPENGNYGCIICENVENNSERQIEVYNKVLEPISKRVLEESFTDFIKHFEEYQKKDIYVFQCDDPKILRLGYVAVCGSGLIHHTVRLSEYKNWQVENKNI